MLAFRVPRSETTPQLARLYCLLWVYEPPRRLWASWVEYTCMGSALNVLVE